MKAQEHCIDLINKLVGEMREAVSGGFISPVHGGKIVRNPKSVTYWAGITNKGETFHSDNQACHAGLGYQYKENYRFIASRMQWEQNPRPLPDEVIDAYLEWLTVSSPYAKAFVFTGGEWTRKYGYVVVRTAEIPANLMSGALFAARMATEHAGTIALIWWYLQKNGVHPDIAYCHAHQITCSDHENVIIDQPMTAHTAWYGKQFTREMVLNFKRHRMPSALPPYNNEKNTREEGRSGRRRNYSPVAMAWSSRPQAYIYGDRIDYLHEKLEDAKKAANAIGVKPSSNIFKANALKTTLPVGPFCEEWAKILIKEYGDENA